MKLDPRLISTSVMLHRPKPSYIIDGIMPDKGLSLLHGQSNAGKSFIGFDIALHVALGRSWHGHDIRNPRQGPVLYVVAEGAESVPLRVDAWLQHYGYEESDVEGKLWWWEEAVDPLNVVEMKKMLNAIKALPVAPCLVVLDTWTELLAAGPADENDQGDTARAAAAWQDVGKGLDSAIFIIGHQGLRDFNRVRGSSGLKGKLVAEFGAYKKQGMVDFKSTKVRDGFVFDKMRFKFDTALCADGSSTAILVPVSIAAKSTPEKEGPEFTKAQQWSLVSFVNLVRARAGARVINGEPLIDELDDVISFTDWMGQSGIAESSLKNYRKFLVDNGYITGVMVGQRQHYKLNVVGQNAVDTLHEKEE